MLEKSKYTRTCGNIQHEKFLDVMLCNAFLTQFSHFLDAFRHFLAAFLILNIIAIWIGYNIRYPQDFFFYYLNIVYYMEYGCYISMVTC